MSETFTNIDNSSELANSLFTTLTSEITVPSIPDLSGPNYTITPDTDSDLYQDIVGATLAELTTAELDGTGAFDVMMQAMDKHIQREFRDGRITGTQYAEVYVGVTNQVIQNATQFVLQKDQARWQAITAQMQARIAEIQATQALIELEKTKFETITQAFQMNLTAAQYGLTKMNIAQAEAQHDGIVADNAIKQFQRNYLQPAELALQHYERTAVKPSEVAINQFQVDRIMPATAAVTEYQNRVLQPLEADIQTLQRDRVVPAQAGIQEYQLNDILPIEKALQQYNLNVRQPAEVENINEQMETQRAQTQDLRSDGLTPVTGILGEQKRNLTVDADTKDYNLDNMMPQQLELLIRQVALTGEQTEAERAKTLDTRTDGSTVEGSVGKQKDLYDQQIDSFVKDAQHKAAKMYLDGWITQKTLDEGLLAPTQLTNNEINAVIASVRTNNNL
jgi:hypothetical protein